MSKEAEESPIKVNKNRWFIPTVCYGCFIDVEFWGSSKDNGCINISVMSNHDESWRSMWRTRIKLAWSVLRGGGAWWMDLNTIEETNNLIDVLVRAKSVAFRPREANG